MGGAVTMEKCKPASKDGGKCDVLLLNKLQTEGRGGDKGILYQ